MSDTFEVGTSGTVELIVNAQSKGRKNTNNQTVEQFVKDQARIYGLKSFSVYVDGQKFYTEQGSQPMSGHTKVEIVAKDSRGFVMSTNPNTPATPAPEPQAPVEGDQGDEQKAA